MLSYPVTTKGILVRPVKKGRENPIGSIGSPTASPASTDSFSNPCLFTVLDLCVFSCLITNKNCIAKNLGHI